MTMRRLFVAGLVTYFLAGCATAYGPPVVVGWSVDRTCEEPNQADLDALAGGAALWAELGVAVQPDSPDATVHVAFCYTAGPAVVLPDGSRYRGHTACAGPDCTTRLNHTEVVPTTYAALVAHEIAHALGVDGHLEHGESGLMTPGGIECAGPCVWTAADLDLLESFGALD